MLAAGTADRIDLLRFPTGVLVVRPPPKGSDDTGGAHPMPRSGSPTTHQNQS